MSTKRNLQLAKAAKNDEFYTLMPDIEKELRHYKNHFKNKVVFCNCDNHNESNFYQYFKMNFAVLGLKKLISTHFNPVIFGTSHKMEVTADANGKTRTKKTPLIGNGDFRSHECVELLKEADVVVTNPPFSLFREYVALMVKHNKNFLIVGGKNAISYKDVFALIKDNKLWLGTTMPKTFLLPDGSYKAAPAVWFTNLSHKKRNEEIILYKKYRKAEYPTYDNYEAIEVSKTKEIPMNYKGLMGVPISFLTKYNPDQFEILGMDRPLMYDLTGKVTRFYIDNNEIYARIVIKNRKVAN